VGDLTELLGKVQAHIALGASVSGVTRRAALLALDEIREALPGAAPATRGEGDPVAELSRLLAAAGLKATLCPCWPNHLGAPSARPPCPCDKCHAPEAARGDETAPAGFVVAEPCAYEFTRKPPASPSTTGGAAPAWCVHCAAPVSPTCSGPLHSTVLRAPGESETVESLKARSAELREWIQGAAPPPRSEEAPTPAPALSETPATAETCGECAYFVARGRGNGACQPNGITAGYVHATEPACSEPGPRRAPAAPSGAGDATTNRGDK
jgi:hypothetical protein